MWNHSIPKFIMNAQKYGRTGFKNCCEICETFKPSQIENFGIHCIELENHHISYILIPLTDPKIIMHILSILK